MSDPLTSDQSDPIPSHAASEVELSIDAPETSIVPILPDEIADAGQAPAHGPQPKWLIWVHTLAVVLLQSTATAVLFILPVIAKKRFGAGDWQTLLITAAPTTLFMTSIFWHTLLRRFSISRYLLVYWACASLPLGLAGFSPGYSVLLVLHLIASIGGAGWSAVHGEMLKHLYPDARGRAFAILMASSMLGGAALSFGIGEWLAHSESAFSIYMPLVAVAQLAGVLLLSWIARTTGAERRGQRNETDASHLTRLIEPIVHMRRILKSDNTFYRYEAAFMTYGIGWMVCYALVPLLVTNKLHLPYDAVAKSTHVVFLLAVVVATLPAGWLMDRLGATRVSSLAFALYTFYPLGLIFTDSTTVLSAASLLYGVCNAGVSVGWMLGPVSLAPTPDKVPQYVAIHTTLVGLRGTLFQGLGVLLYTQTHSFTIPLFVAAFAFVWAAWQMRQLHERMKKTTQSRSREP